LLCFNKHPYFDGAKLRIINGNYKIPSTDTEFNEFHDLIRCMFDVDPSKRPDINQVIFHLENMAQSKSIDLNNTCLTFLKKTEALFSQTTQVGNTLSPPLSSNPPRRPSPPPPQQQQPQTSSVDNKNKSSTSLNNNETNQSGSNWMDRFKGGLQTMKVASTKMMDSVQQSMRNDIDLNYITPRLVVCSFPTEGLESAAFGNNCDAIKETLETKHSKNYRIYNLAVNKQVRKDRFSQVVDVGDQLVSGRVPSVSFMIKLCSSIIKYLNENKANCCVIVSEDGRLVACQAVCTLIMYCHLMRELEDCVNAFESRRGVIQNLPSSYRYLKNTQDLFDSTRGDPSAPVNFILPPNEFILLNIQIVGIPLFNRLRNGCTPFVEIYNRDSRIYTSQQDYEKMRKYTYRDGRQIVMPINCHKFYGDLTIIIYHAKSILGYENVSNKICQLQFHTAFIANQLLKSNGQIVFNKNDLDYLDSAEKYPEGFQVILNMELKSSQSPLANEEPWNTQELKYNLNSARSECLFTNAQEISQFRQIFDKTRRVVYKDGSITSNDQLKNDIFSNYNNNEDEDSTTDDENTNHHAFSHQKLEQTQPETQSVAEGNLLDFANFASMSTTTPTASDNINLINDNFELLLDLNGSGESKNAEIQKTTTITSQTLLMDTKTEENLFSDEFIFTETTIKPTCHSNLNDIFESNFYFLFLFKI
jgi:cyclin G-associated kinase